MSRSERLLSLLQTLRRHRRPVSGRALADELGVSIRTLYRDIATLQDQGAAIEGEAGLGYVLKPGFMLPPLMFGEDEVDAIILGLRFVARRGDGELTTAAIDALSKIVDLLPADFENVVATSGLLAGRSGSGAVDVLSVIRKAIRNVYRDRPRPRGRTLSGSEGRRFPAVPARRRLVRRPGGADPAYAGDARSDRRQTELGLSVQARRHRTSAPATPI